MPISPDIVALDLSNPVEGLLTHYRRTEGEGRDISVRMAGDFAAVIAELQDARQALIRAQERVPKITSFGYVRGGIVGPPGTWPRKKQIEAMLP